jgi:glycogen operon protein
MLLVNANAQSREFVLPAIAKGVSWRLFVDTAAQPPYDIFPDLDGPRPPKSFKLMLASRALCCYVAER